MEEHLYALLDGAVNAPVAWGPLSSAVTLPRVTLHRVSGVRDMSLDGPGTMTSRVQIDCFGETFRDALVASREVRTALEGYRGGPIQGAFLDAVRDGFETDVGLAHRVSLSFIITYQE